MELIQEKQVHFFSQTGKEATAVALGPMEAMKLDNEMQETFGTHEGRPPEVKEFNGLSVYIKESPGVELLLHAGNGMTMYEYMKGSIIKEAEKRIAMAIQ